MRAAGSVTLGARLLAAAALLTAGHVACAPHRERPAVSGEEWRQAQQGMTRFLELVEDGRLGEARQVFLRRTHPTLHRLIPLLQERDLERATQTYGAKVALEEELVRDPPQAEVILDRGRALAEALEEAGELLGLVR